MKNERYDGKQLPPIIKELMLKQNRIANGRIIIAMSIVFVLGAVELLLRNTPSGLSGVLIAAIPAFVIVLLCVVGFGYIMTAETKIIKSDNFSWRYGIVTKVKRVNSMIIELYVDDEYIRTYRAKSYKKHYANEGDCVYVIYFGEHFRNKVFPVSFAGDCLSKEK